jgi:hypothetical protein
MRSQPVRKKLRERRDEPALLVLAHRPRVARQQPQWSILPGCCARAATRRVGAPVGAS